jgi:WD40 repeat protein
LQAARHIPQFATFDSAEQRVATCDAAGNVLVWNVADGKHADQLAVGAAPVASFWFETEHALLAITADGVQHHGSLDRDWQLVRTIGAPDDTSSLEDRITAMDFSPDDQWLAVGGGQPSRGGELEIYGVLSGELAREFKDAHSDTVFGLAFSPDGKLLASCGADRFMKVFDVESTNHVRTFEGHTHHVLSVSWRADGRVLATGGADKVVKLWNFADGSQIRTIQGFGKEVTSLQFAGSTDALFATCGDQHLYRCDMGGDRRSVGQGKDFLYVVSVDLIGKSIAFGGHDSIVRAVDADGKQRVELSPAAP